MKLKSHSRSPRSVWRLAGGVAGLIVGALWLAMLLAELLPAHWMRWHVVADIEVAGQGWSRVYFDDGKGITEAKTIDGAVHEGRQRVRFVLPERVLQGLRFDPIDQAGLFTVRDLRLVGPFGTEVTADGKGKEKPVELSIKADQAVNAKQVAGTDEAGSERKGQPVSVSFRADNEDPHFYLGMKPKLVVPPSRAHDVADAVVLLFSVLMIFVFVFALPARHRAESIERIVFALAAAAVVAWVLAHYLLTVRQIDPAFSYRLVLPLLLLAPLCSWLRGALALRTVPIPALALVAWLSYFGVRALAVRPGSVPSRLDLLVATFFLLALLAAGLVCGPRRWRRYLGLGFVLWLPVAVWAAVAILIKSYHPDWDLDYRAAYFEGPLFRPISGSACFALGAVALVALAGRQSQPAWLRGVMILMLAILCVYFLQAKSRAVVVGAVVAVIFVMALARSLQVTIAACMALALCAVFALTLWPNFLADALTSENTPVPDEQKGRIDETGETVTIDQTGESVRIDETGETVRIDETGETPVSTGQPYRVAGTIVRPDALRPGIYAAYLRASMKHPLFGHGFAGDHTVLIESEEIRKVQPEFVGRGWNPHNFHLSVLYFGGIVGVALHAAMLGLPMWFGLRAFLKDSDPVLLALLGMVAFAGVKLLFESTMMNVAKDAVVFWKPNEYWLFFWGPLILLNVHLAHLRTERSGQYGSRPEFLPQSAQ